MANRSKSPKPPTPKLEAASENTSQVRLEELARTSTELARIVAKNSSAAPELLQELGSSSDDTTRKGVASNPNTSTDVLLKLGAQFPAQLLENPVFPLLLLENPNLLVDMPLATLRSLLKRDTVPESFLEWAAGSTDEGVLLAVAMNSNTPKSALSKLIQNQNADVAEAAKLHVNWAGEMSQGWEKGASSAMEATRLPRDHQKEASLWAIGAIPEFLVPTLHGEVRLSIAQNPNTPAHILEMLAGDSDRHSKIRVALAQNPNTPVSLLIKLARDPYYLVRDFIAQNPKTPLTILSQSQTPPETFRDTSTNSQEQNSNISISPFNELVDDQNINTRRALAQNPDTPAIILEQLAGDDCVEVRYFVACHFNTPQKVLEQLARDGDELVRQAVVKNLYVPVSLLEQMVEDPNIKVRQVVAKEAVVRTYLLKIPLRVLEQLACEQDIYVRQLVAQNPDTPASILEQLAKDNININIRRAVSQNLSTSVGTLTELAQDQDIHVRRAVARNSNTPTRILEQLAGDQVVRTAVADNPNTPVEIIKQMGAANVDLAWQHNTPKRILEYLAEHPDNKIRRAIARNPNTPKRALEQLAVDSDYEIRRYVASNSNTSANALERLAEDSDWVTLENIALNPNTSGNVLEKLAGNENERVQKAVFHSLKRIPKNSAILDKIFQKLVEGSLRSQVPQHPSAPLKLLAQFAQGSDSWVQKSAINNLCQNIFHNPNIPGNFLEQLVEIKDSKLGIAIAHQPYVPERALEKLAKHQDWKVRMVVAKNPNTPIKVLERLLEDKYRYVRQAAIANLSQNFNARESILNQWLAVQNPETPQDTIAQLTTSEWLLIRECIALHPNASTTVLEQLAKDKSSAVRSSVAQNPHTPGNLLEQLAQDKDQEVAIAVAQNPNTPVSILEQFAQQGKQNNQIKQAALKNLFSQYPDRVVPFLEEYIKSFQPSFTRLLVFLHPLAPSSFLAKNFRSSSWLERYAIAQNPNTPAATRQRLAQDGNRIVRAAATNLQDSANLM